MAGAAPQVLVIGGPNGAGKTTIARDVLLGALGITEFVKVLTTQPDLPDQVHFTWAVASDE